MVLMNSKTYLDAVEQGDTELVKEQLDSGSFDVNESDEHGRTALIKAAKHGHVDIVRVLVSRGADVNARDNRGTNALYWASSNGHTDIVEELIRHHSDVEVFDNRGWSAKDQASTAHYDRIVNMLEAAGA
jgi:ankyrin repeat protein